LPTAFGAIIDGLPWIAARRQRRCCRHPARNLDECVDGQKMLNWERCDADDLRQRIVRLRGLVETKLSDEERSAFLHNDWFRAWLDGYEKNEAILAMLDETAGMVGIAGTELVDFVLQDDDPYRRF
jgi:hypothetical protein